MNIYYLYIANIVVLVINILLHKIVNIQGKHIVDDEIPCSFWLPFYLIPGFGFVSIINTISLLQAMSTDKQALIDTDKKRRYESELRGRQEVYEYHRYERRQKNMTMEDKVNELYKDMKNKNSSSVYSPGDFMSGIY